MRKSIVKARVDDKGMLGVTQPTPMIFECEIDGALIFFM